MNYAKKERTCSAREAILLVQKEADRIRKLLASSCAPDWYEVLDQALQKHLVEEVNILRLTAEAEEKRMQ